MQLRSEYSGIFWPELLLASSGLLSFFLRDPRFLLGLALPVLPFFEYGALSCFILTFCFGCSFRKDRPEVNQNVLVFLSLLLVPLSVTLIFSLIQEVDLTLLKTILLNSGPLGFLDYTQENYPVWYRAIYHFASYVNFSLLILFLPADTFLHKNFSKGLASGVAFSCLVGLAQLAEVHPWVSVNREPFWLFVKRYEGTFTDPNALGVMAVLLLPYFYYLRKSGSILWIASFLLAGFSIFSESRTFWLGIFIWFVVVNIKTPKRLLLLTTPLVLLIPSLNSFLQSLPVLSRFTRILQTLNYNTFLESLYSRLLMGEIAIRMWQKAPILGVGLERFYEAQQAVAKAAGLDLGDWRDNANNFYLQVASEQGLYGLAMLLALFSYLFFLARKQNRNISSTLLLILSVLFLTGPHLFFEEVKYFVAIIVGDLVRNSGRVIHSTELNLNSRRLKIMMVSIFLLGLLLIANVSVKQRALLGFWGVEVGENSEQQAWTSAKGYLRLCNVPEKESLQVRSYDLPMSIDVIQNGISRQITLPDTEWHNIDLVQSELVNVSLTPSKVWTPSAGRTEGDKRWLGAMVKIPKYLCK